jgi:uncharacterized membrane protein
MANLRKLPLCVLAGALLSIGVSSAQSNRISATPTNRIVSQVDDSQLVTLHGTLNPRANARNDLGVAPDSLQLNRMHLVLKRSASQEAALQQLIAGMNTPGSPNYHKWLTPDQFGAQFGPSDQDIATVTSWLANHGFNVLKVNPGRQTIEVSGSVAQLRNTFHTQIHQYSIDGQVRYANASNPEIPAALAPVVGGFVSLNNFPIRSYAHSLGKAQYDPKTNQSTPQWTVGNNSGISLVLAPQDFAAQYNVTPLYSAGTNGSGQTIAIINEANINISQVNQFRSLFGLPSNPPQVIVDGNDPGIDGINNPYGPNFASFEAYLDVEWAGAVAPNANIDLVIAGDTALQNGLILAAERAIYSNIAPIMSISFGNCEKNLGSSNAFLSSLWEQAAAQGITVIVSSGDSGSAGCDNDSSQAYATGGQGVNGFASTPYNVAVGGTDFYYSQYNGTSAALSSQISGYWNTTPSNTTPIVSIKGNIPEQPWNSSQYGLNFNSYYNAYQTTTIASGGGGASNAAICANNSYSSSGACTSSLSGYPKPTWQTGVPGIPNDGVRDIPDVSLFGSSGINASYYPICADDGDCQSVSSGMVQISGVGGTSASAPAFAGIMALVNQRYGRQGQANTVLYPLARQFPNSFYDVTNGTISVPCSYSPTLTSNCISVSNPITVSTSSGPVLEGQIGSGTTPEYNATAGFDLATGLGTINATNLVNNWNKVTLAATTTTMTATPASGTLNSIAHGTSVTIAGSVTGSGTPTGDVALMTDSTEQSQQGATKFTLKSDGTYSGTTANLPGGTYNIWTQYGGDSVNGLSTSAKTQITVNPEASAIDFNMFSGTSYFTPGGTSPGTSVDYGTQFLLNALVAPSSQAAALQNCLINGTGCSSVSFTAPTGIVTFADNGSAFHTSPINSEGHAEYNAPFSIGAHSVTAAYAGDGSYNAATTTSPITFTVVKDTPQFNLDASALSTVGSTTSAVNGPNQPLVITLQVINGAQVNASSSNNIYPVPVAPPTGTVTVTGMPSGVNTSATLLAGVDPSSLGGYQAPQGVANFIVPAGTTSGTYNVTFTYNGDSNYNSSSKSYSIPITNTSGAGQNSTITATISGTATSPNAALNVAGTVTGTSGHAAPTGDVFVYASGYYIGDFVVSAPSSGIISSFSGQLNSSTIPQGANQITLQYSGDSIYNPSAYTLNGGLPISNPLSDFAIVPTVSNIPVTAGSSGTTSISLASMGGFTGTVSLTCAAASGVTCSLPASAILTGGGNASATLTVNAPSGTPSGNYNLLVTGKDASGLYIHTAAITAMVSGASGAQGFTVVSSNNINIAPGAASGNTSTITITPTNGFTGTVNLGCSVTTAPFGASTPITCSVPASVNIASASPVAPTLTINSTAATTVGNYVVTVTGTSGSVTQTATVNVTVAAFTLTANPVSLSFNPAATTGNTSTITVTPVNSFTGAVALSCSVTTIPTGATSPITCSIPSPVNLSGSSQTSNLTVTSTASTTPGSYAITVTGTSGSITQSATIGVAVMTPGTFALSSSGSITVTRGATTGNTSTITVTPSNSFTGAVSLSCSITPSAANPPTCALSPTSVNITSGAVTSTLTITTSASTTYNNPLKLFWPASGGGVALAVLFLFVPRRRRNWLGMMALLIVLASGIAIGCGGGGGGGGSTPPPNTSNYTVTVTGTSGTKTASTTVSLTVK